MILSFYSFYYLWIHFSVWITKRVAVPLLTTKVLLQYLGRTSIVHFHCLIILSSFLEWKILDPSPIWGLSGISERNSSNLFLKVCCDMLRSLIWAGKQLKISGPLIGKLFLLIFDISFVIGTSNVVPFPDKSFVLIDISILGTNPLIHFLV